ncbi:MAG: RNA 2',3'-cyclic phosphodiesterase [Candidatus Harrisonbacteria bacterium]|nr:RNA 2',3'-cyclic phosphodiesterase [Candidatus Harrisonbacteria bacterium]
MKRKRAFIAIQLPKAIRNALERAVATLAAELPEAVRFLEPEQWHFTLTFLGYQTDEDIGKIIAALGCVVPRFPAPDVMIERIVYGPHSKTPRMIWAVTDDATSLALGKLKEAIEDELAARGVGFEREARAYTGHVTLARFASGIGELPDVHASLRLTFTPAMIELMESHLSRSGAEYTALAGVDFKDDIA